MIKISKLNKYFYRKKSNEIHVINDTSLEFPETGLVTILGESGSGKTTLMNVIGGLDDFYSGSIEIDDFKINKYSSRVMDRIRNEKVGYIFQNYLLLQGRTVYENLEILLNMYDLTEEQKNERIEYVLKAVGMMKYKKKSVSELSGGQQQRVAIARALIKSPSLILADEPTGNLDEKNTIQIMNIIKKISKNTLVILVSHEMSIATSYSDYIIQVQDGKVVHQGDVKDHTSYQYEDDQNLYLKEYKYSKIENDNVNIDFYSNENEKVNIQIVYEKGKFYIKSSNDVIYLNDESEVKLIDEHKKILNTEEEIADNDYELETLKFVKTPSLPFKEKVRLAFSNLNKMKKRTFILSLPLFLIVILVLLSVQSIKSAAYVDKQTLVYSDSHIYNISVESGHSRVNTAVQMFGFNDLHTKLMQAVPEVETELECDVDFYFTLPSFSQITLKRYMLKGFSVLSNERLKEEDLMYGRLPQTATELVVEKWVLENALSDSTLANFMDVTSFINKTVIVTDKKYPFTIVGIADNDENTIYMNKWVMLNIAPAHLKKNGVNVISVSEYEKMSNTKLDTTLAIDDIILNLNGMEYYGSETIKLNDDTNLIFNVKEKILFKNCQFDAIVSDECYQELFKSVAAVNHDMLLVYCDDDIERDKVSSFIDSVKDYYANGELKATAENGFDKPADFKEVKLIVNFKSQYYDVINPFIEESNKNVSSRLLITIAILFISAIIVFFSMKSYSIKNIYDIGVYRAIGINKRSIAFVYALQIFIISLKTTLVGGLICFALTQIISGVPFINAASFAISFDLFLVCTLGLILFNVLVGTLPVVLCMRLTPSKLLTKYDI